MMAIAWRAATNCVDAAITCLFFTYSHFFIKIEPITHINKALLKNTDYSI